MAVVLLFVRKQYEAEIVAGRKRYEIRHGARYARIGPGDELSINGHFRVRVTKVDKHDTTETLPTDVSDCYPAATGPFYVMHF